MGLVGVRLLVVDDDADAREMLDATLRQYYRAAVATASSVREALGALEAGTCDVLLSDLAMPGEDGYDLIQAVRRHADPDVRRIAAIAVTAHADEAHKARALAGGFDDVVTKPVDADRLIRAIERALARRAAKGTTAH